MCFNNHQANNCTHVHSSEPTMHALHRAALTIKEGSRFSLPSHRNHSSPIKVSASPPAQRHVERTMSWLWEAFSSCEHLSITLKWAASSKSATFEKSAEFPNNEMKSCSQWGVLSPVKDTVSQSHQSDKGLLPSSGFPPTGPSAQQMPLDGVLTRNSEFLLF